MKVSFKYPQDRKHLEEIHPNLFYLLGCFVKYAYDRGLPVTITSIIRDKLSGSVSKTHEEGRAIDISCNGWSVDQCLAAEEYMNRNYPHIAAISSKTFMPAACVYHNVGHGVHFHIQVRP